MSPANKIDETEEESQGFAPCLLGMVSRVIGYGRSYGFLPSLYRQCLVWKYVVRLADRVQELNQADV